MQNCAAPSDDAAWRMRFSCTKCCASSRPWSTRAEHRVGADAHVGERHLGVVGRHVERPPEEVDVEARRVGGHEERGDADGRARLARRAGEDDVVGGVVQPGVEPLHAVDHPLVAVAHGGGLEVGGVGAVVRLGQPEGEAAGAVEEAGHPLRLLLVGAEVAHHQHRREVADDRALVLQVVVQPEALGREVLADDRHLEVGGVAAAVLGRQREPEPARPRRPGGASRASSSSQSCARHAAVLEVGARALAPVVEEPDVVVLPARAA